MYFPDSLKYAILPSALKSCYYDSTLVAIPLFVDVGLMYYRKDLIDRLPNAKVIEDELHRSITWGEFENPFKECEHRLLQIRKAIHQSQAMRANAQLERDTVSA